MYIYSMYVHLLPNGLFDFEYVMSWFKCQANMKRCKDAKQR